MTAITHNGWDAPRRPAAFLLTLVLAAVLALAIIVAGESALYGLLALVLFGVFLRYPVFGLYLTTALLLLSGSATIVGDLRLRIPVTAAKVCGFAAFLAWLSGAVARGERIRFTLAMAILCAFLGWTAIGVAMSSTWRLQWAEWVRLLTLVAYFLLAVNLLDTPKRLRIFVILILLCGLGMALFAIAQYFFTGLHLEIGSAEADIGVRAEGAYIEYDAPRGGPAIRVSGGTGHSNWLAMIILMIMPLNVYWFMTSKTLNGKTIALVAVFLEIGALVLTFTRTGFLVGAVVLAILGARNLVRFTPQRVAAVAVALFLSWFLLPSAYKERVLNFTQYGQSASVHNRVELQKAAWDLLTENPLWGVGLGGYGPHLLERNVPVAKTMRWFVETYHWPPEFIGAHNMYLQIGCETGVIGLALMLVFFAVIMHDLRRANRTLEEMHDRDGAALTSTIEVGLIAFLVCALFLHALQQKIWWMIAAMAAVAPLYQATLAKANGAVKAK